MSSWHFCALGTHILVTCEHEPLVRRLAVLLGSYEASARAPDYTYELRRQGEGFVVERNRLCFYQSESLDEVTNFFLLDLYRRVVRGGKGQWRLHAAAVAKEGRALVLAGPSDSGKSTLTRALMRGGWAYLSEEVVALADGGIDALRRPLHLARRSEFDELPAGLSQPMELVSGPSKGWVVPPPPAGDPVDKVAALVRLRYLPEGATCLRAYSASAALKALWPCRMNSGLDTAQLASSLVAKIPCYGLDASEVEGAVAALNAIPLA